MMLKQAYEIAIATLIKLGAHPPDARVWADRIHRKRKDFAKPLTDRELDDMFPPGWEKKNPSVQDTILQSNWMRDANSAKARGKATPKGFRWRDTQSQSPHGAGSSPFDAYYAAQKRYQSVRKVRMAARLINLGILGAFAAHGAWQHFKKPKQRVARNRHK